MAEQEQESQLIDLNSEPLKSLLAQGQRFFSRKPDAHIRVANPGQYNNITVPDNNTELETFDKYKMFEIDEHDANGTYVVSGEDLYYQNKGYIVEDFSVKEDKLPAGTWQKCDLNPDVRVILNPYNTPIHFDNGINTISGGKDYYLLTDERGNTTTASPEELRANYNTYDVQRVFSSPDSNPVVLDQLWAYGTHPYAMPGEDGETIQVEVQEMRGRTNPQILVLVNDNNELTTHDLIVGTNLYRTEKGEIGLATDDQVATWEKLDLEKTPIRLNSYDPMLKEAVNEYIIDKKAHYYTLVQTGVESNKDLFIEREQDMVVIDNPYDFRRRQIDIINDQGEVQSSADPKGKILVSPTGKMSAMTEDYFNKVETTTLPTTPKNDVTLIASWRLKEQKYEFAAAKQAAAEAAPKQPRQKQKSADGPEMDF